MMMLDLVLIVAGKMVQEYDEDIVDERFDDNESGGIGNCFNNCGPSPTLQEKFLTMKGQENMKFKTILAHHLTHVQQPKNFQPRRSIVING